LVAALAADMLSQADEPVDPQSPTFAPTMLASSVGEALAKYLDRQPVADRVRVRGLLTALGYARGPGVDDVLWLGFPGRLGQLAGVGDLDALRATAAADYLLQTSRSRGAPVTRLFHQTLADELLATRDRKTDEHKLLDGLLPTPPATLAGRDRVRARVRRRPR